MVDIVNISGLKYKIPTKWEHISRSNILKIASYLLADTLGNRIKILEKFCGMGLILAALSDEQILLLCERLDWIYQSNIPIISPIKIKGKTYIMPSESLLYSTLIEYIFADSLSRAIANGDSSKLSELACTLLREYTSKPQNADYDGDDRVKYNPIISQKNSEANPFPLYIQLYVLLVFVQQRYTIAKTYPDLFDSPSNNKKTDNWGLLGVAYELSGGFINEESVQYSNLHNAFTYLTYQIKKQEKVDIK